LPISLPFNDAILSSFSHLALFLVDSLPLRHPFVIPSLGTSTTFFVLSEALKSLLVSFMPYTGEQNLDIYDSNLKHFERQARRDEPTLTLNSGGTITFVEKKSYLWS
jgi:hypothetical protein